MKTPKCKTRSAVFSALELMVLNGGCLGQWVVGVLNKPRCFDRPEVWVPQLHLEKRSRQPTIESLLVGHVRCATLLRKGFCDFPLQLAIFTCFERLLRSGHGGVRQSTQP